MIIIVCRMWVLVCGELLIILMECGSTVCPKTTLKITTHPVESFCTGEACSIVSLVVASRKLVWLCVLAHAMALTLKDYLDRPLHSYCSEILQEWCNVNKVNVPVKSKNDS